MQNEVQYDLDRKAAKISALSPNNLDKYEYLTGEDLGLKPNTIEQARFEYSSLGRIFNKGLDKDDKKEELFKKLKKYEQKNLIRNDDNKIVYYTPRSEFDDKDDKYKKNQQNNNIDTKPPNIFNYLKSLSQEAKDLMDEIENANDDIDDGKLLFIGSDKEKFNFNTFRKPLNFISTIYNGKTSLKEAKIFQKHLEKKIYQLLIQVNELFEYKNKIIDAFKDGIFFCLNILKKNR